MTEESTVDKLALRLAAVDEAPHVALPHWRRVAQVVITVLGREIVAKRIDDMEKAEHARSTREPPPLPPLGLDPLSPAEKAQHVWEGTCD